MMRVWRKTDDGRRDVAQLTTADLIAEQLTRTSTFLGANGLSSLRSSFVIVVGLGGVGSHCTTALARSGVSRIRLIDFDQVTLSSLNRHAVATLADVGTPKVHCVRKRLEAVTPWVQWDCLNELWRVEEAARLLGPSSSKETTAGEARKPDWVVDAIDNIDSKVALLKYCHANGLPVISSMGAGCKSDPTQILIGDISTSLEDPLSRATRRRLKLQGVSDGIPVVYSTEKPGLGKATLLPLPEEEFQRGQVGQLGVLPDFRARILPVLGSLPAAFGYVAANFIMLAIAGYPHDMHHGKGRDKLYESVLAQLQASEEKLVRAGGGTALGLKVPLTRDEVGFLVDDVFRGKSAISGLATRLTLMRWRAAEGGYNADERWKGQVCARLKLDDLVCMSKEEAAAHEKTVLLGKARPEDVYDTSVVELVEKRKQEAAAMLKYR